MVYDPLIQKYNNIFFLIFGGVSFLLARIIMSVAYIVYPFKSKTKQTIKININKIVYVLLFTIVTSGSVCCYFIINMKSSITMKILVSVYFILMGTNLALSIYRLRGFEEETLKSQLFAFLGTFLFNVSDTILCWNMFIRPIAYGDVISITIYWLSMYLIMISIVRTSSDHLEKNIDQIYFQIQNNIN
jgi:hypothetical protein